MASIRSNGSRTTELAWGKLLWHAGLRGYRKHWRVIGKPDFAWPGRKVALFIDGCFWHGCRKCKTVPRTNTRFWRDKFENNRRRDRRVKRQLRNDGWIVIRVRECLTAKQTGLTAVASALKTRGRPNRVALANTRERERA